MNSFIVDSFTKERFKGNPAAVCILKAELSVENMQLIASEFNLSETAFIKKISEDSYSIRYFSPLQEIDLCGHATLASAKVLFEEEGIKEVVFITSQGLKLECQLEGGEIAMLFPLYETSKADYTPALIKALGIEKPLNCEYNSENNVLLIEIEDAKSVQELSPDFEALIRSHDAINGVAVTAKSTDEYDFYSRYFWPWAGGNEDPVTGAIHTFLASYWGKRLKKKRMNAYQASSRGGYLNLDILNEKVLKISSEAQIILKGILDLSST